jgi:hypothetical protein
MGATMGITAGTMAGIMAGIMVTMGIITIEEVMADMD